MNKTLILGAKGNLGVQLAKVFSDGIFWDREDCDVLNAEMLHKKLSDVKDSVGVVVNCVAYNDVDGAEENSNSAFALNEEVPRQLAKQTDQLGMTFVHISTGYVFSGQKESYLETDIPDPVSVYGKSKAAGEDQVIKLSKNYYIVRTNLLFGPKGLAEGVKPSVVDTMYVRGIETKLLKGIGDEWASFTYTPDLAKSIKKIIDDKMPFGIYHIVNEGFGSWYDLAVEIFKDDPSVIIEKVPAATFQRKAARPIYSVLQNTKFPKLRSWQEALSEYLSFVKNPT